MKPTAPSPLAPVAGEASFLRLPDRHTVFHARAERCRSLASRRSAMPAYLGLMAQLADAQQIACDTLPHRVSPDNTASASTGDRWRPLPASQALPLEWLETLRRVIDHLNANDGPFNKIVGTLRALSTEGLEAQAYALLSGHLEDLDRGAAPVIAAALQAYWTARTPGLDAAAMRGPDGLEHGCPVCGSLPVASLIVTGGDTHGLRYLCCSLCSTQWHLPRIHCVHCGSTQGVAYYGIAGSDGAVRTEACDDCRTYTKILDREKQVQLDPFADDLASLPLDLMMAEAGFMRFGVNPFMIPGE